MTIEKLLLWKNDRSNERTIAKHDNLKNVRIYEKKEKERKKGQSKKYDH
jgi:hypothetical protein